MLNPDLAYILIFSNYMRFWWNFEIFATFENNRRIQPNTTLQCPSLYHTVVPCAVVISAAAAHMLKPYSA